MSAAFFQHEYLGNPVSAYLVGGAWFMAVLWGFLVTRRLAARGGPSLATDLIDQVRAYELVILALSAGTHELDLPHRAEHVLHIVTVLVIAYRVVGLLSTMAGYAIRRTILSDPSDRANQDTAATATLAVKGLIWLGAVLFVLSNAGYNVSSMIAGLGIGGVAVALAAQAVLGDLFAALAIYLDKPFVAGDSIKVGDFFGTVDHIGIKTTRVRSLGGEMLVFPNSMLTGSRIQNYRLMEERRVVLSFSVPLATPTETLKKIPQQIKAIVGATEGTRFDRAHLSEFKESGLAFEAVYWVLSPDYAAFMDRQQAVLIALLDALRADGIPLAQPTRTVVLEGKP